MVQQGSNQRNLEGETFHRKTGPMSSKSQCHEKGILTDRREIRAIAARELSS